MMNRIGYIFALLLSLYIVYIGGGVICVDYCCAECENLGLKVIETEGCHSHHHHEEGCEHHCSGSGECEITIESLDMDEVVAHCSINPPYTPLFILPIVLQLIVPEEHPLECIDPSVSPPPLCTSSRYYLNLYATLLI